MLVHQRVHAKQCVFDPVWSQGIEVKNTDVIEAVPGSHLVFVAHVQILWGIGQN